MSSIAGTPTLLVFTLGAPAERARRPLLPRRLAALEVGMRRACAEEALAAGREAGLATAVCSPAPLGLDADSELPQRQGPFGARLEMAMAEAFAGGAAPLVVVGADTPGLAAVHVAQALALLAARPTRSSSARARTAVSTSSPRPARSPTSPPSAGAAPTRWRASSPRCAPPSGRSSCCRRSPTSTARRTSRGGWVAARRTRAGNAWRSGARSSPARSPRWRGRRGRAGWTCRPSPPYPSSPAARRPRSSPSDPSRGRAPHRSRRPRIAGDRRAPEPSWIERHDRIARNLPDRPPRAAGRAARPRHPLVPGRRHGLQPGLHPLLRLLLADQPHARDS